MRNVFEEHGYEPILFYLHSLTDEDEISDLIKREIDARLWFCLCDSINAKNSRWVQSELDYVKKRGKITFAKIDLDSMNKMDFMQKKERCLSFCFDLECRLKIYVKIVKCIQSTIIGDQTIFYDIFNISLENQP